MSAQSCCCCSSLKEIHQDCISIDFAYFFIVKDANTPSQQSALNEKTQAICVVCFNVIHLNTRLLQGFWTYLKSVKLEQACGDLGLCNKTESVILAAASNSNEINCELCEYLASMVKEQLDDPDTEADILSRVAQVGPDFCLERSNQRFSQVTYLS